MARLKSHVTLHELAINEFEIFLIGMDEELFGT